MLTDIAIRKAKSDKKPYKMADGRGLYLLVNKSGKYFRFDYWFAGKRKTLALGVYPEIKLSGARGKHDGARKLIREGVDPGLQRKIEKITRIQQTENNLRSVALEWFSKIKHVWTEGHSRTVKSRLEKNVFPLIGNHQIAEISSPELLGMMRMIESRGAVETAHRIKQVCGQIFRYAIPTGRAERDLSADLKGVLKPAKSKRMATITNPEKVGELLRAIDGYEGNLVTRCALKLVPLVFVRRGELRHAEWE